MNPLDHSPHEQWLLRPNLGSFGAVDAEETVLDLGDPDDVLTDADIERLETRWLADASLHVELRATGNAPVMRIDDILQAAGWSEPTEVTATEPALVAADTRHPSQNPSQPAAAVRHIDTARSRRRWLTAVPIAASFTAAAIIGGSVLRSDPTSSSSDVAMEVQDPADLAVSTEAPAADTTVAAAAETAPAADVFAAETTVAAAAAPAEAAPVPVDSEAVLRAGEVPPITKEPNQPGAAQPAESSSEGAPEGAAGEVASEGNAAADSGEPATTLFEGDQATKAGATPSRKRAPTTPPSPVPPSIAPPTTIPPPTTVVPGNAAAVGQGSTAGAAPNTPAEPAAPQESKAITTVPGGPFKLMKAAVAALQAAPLPSAETLAAQPVPRCASALLGQVKSTLTPWYLQTEVGGMVVTFAVFAEEKVPQRTIVAVNVECAVVRIP
jgi:hypothetical protein